jgi:hypothetical protein
MERFLYDHIGFTVAALFAPTVWAAERHLITEWHYKAACFGISTVALYLCYTQGPADLWLIPMTLLTAATGLHVYRTRPPHQPLDGSHEAL